MNFSDLFVPIIIAAVFFIGIFKKINVIEEFTKGAAEGLKTAVEILPSLILLMTAVGMFTASGAGELIAKAISPVTSFLGFPDECVCLAIIRPISGSGALAALETVLTGVSPDSYSGRVASVLMGSTETTFYTITVYFAALKQKADSKIFIAAAIADLAGFIFSALTVRLLLT